MIAFACSRCAQKFQVKDEFAGRKTRCPTCKQSLVVPETDFTQAPVPGGAIDGTPSSVAQAGLAGGVTLGQAGQPSRPGQQPLEKLLAGRAGKGERYFLDGEIARGGMGAVLRAVDGDLRREVAVKYLLDQADPRKKIRFVEEAQITGQLEHPNIVPIHELGVDSQKRLFFSMKMVKGRSLAEVVNELRQNPRAAEKDYSLSRLLSVFVNICHALAYAHSRGVIHRDLKPANIMLGDFGEVYVMDWGLAKVLGAEEPADAAVAPKRHSKVETSREAEADLTQQGSILGTPAYMPPEQALGNVRAVDARSDVYALGAILYELLTLQPPVAREGGHLAILVRVAEGAIVPPEQRAPERARAGKIPRELAAVALKALAKDPAGRYPSVEDLRRDIELFQEGRSVSAKQDSLRELVWKLVKRNKAASVAATAVVLVLLASLVTISRAWLGTRQAWQETSRAYAAYQDEQKDKRERTRQAIPAFIEAARLTANHGQPDEALKQVGLALVYEPDNPDARLLKGELLLAQKDLAGARAELDAYLRQRPGDTAAQQLLKPCLEGKLDDTRSLIAVARVFQQHRLSGLAVLLLREAGKNKAAREQLLLDLYRDKIGADYGQEMRNGLKLNAEGLILLEIRHQKQIGTLAPLMGMLLDILVVWDCSITDLEPLRDMPLIELGLQGNSVRDLEPLRGMLLTRLNLIRCPVQNLEPLRNMPLATLLLNDSPVADLEPLRDMPLTSLSLHGCKEVRTLEPLKALRQLKELNVSYCGQIQKLEPLKGLPLTSLRLVGSNVHDLRPLEGMSLQIISLDPWKITMGINVLRPEKMKSLRLIETARALYNVDEFWKRFDAGEFKK